jgi:hypothetical protein
MSNDNHHQGAKTMDILSDDNFGLLLKASAVTLPTKIHKTLRMVEDGKLTKEAATQVFAHLATERYGADRLAVSKFMADGDGQRLCNAMVVAERAVKLNERANPASEQRPQPEPSAEQPSEAPTTNADENTPNKFAAYAKEMIDAHAAQNGISQHHAIDDLLKTSPYFRILLNAAKGQTVQHSRATQEVSA